METPSSTRRVTRSQTLASSATKSNTISTFKKLEDSEKGLTKSRKNPAALVDITNDSPIVGLAMGNFETPSSTMSKKMGIIISSRATKPENTPGSGEALLRGQVKTLLQKVEGESELSKLSVEHGHGGTPFLAPTPANTPHILNLLASTAPSSPVEDKFEISQMVSGIIEGKKEEEVNELDKSMIVTRSLLLDFSEKSEVSYSSKCSSEVTFQETESESGKEKSVTEDDDASIWSIQVNASTKDDGEEEEVEEEYDDSEDYYYEEGESELVVDELCEAVSKISVNGGDKTMTKFIGKHTRFCYNSDDEIEGEEEEVVGGSGNESASGGGALRLKGLPTPRGKHVRFPEEMDAN